MSGCGPTARKVTIVLGAALALVATGGSAASAVGRTGRSAHAPALVLATRSFTARIGTQAHGSSSTVAVGGNPIGDAVDQATHTVYVANNSDNTVSLINAATCNATHTTGCGKHPPAVKVGVAPIGDAVDQKTDTIYVVNTGDGTVSVIDGKTCNAKVTSGCGSVQTIPVGGGPNVDAVDEATDTIYVANNNDDTVSAIDGATCNSMVRSGCRKTPPVVHVGGGPDGLGVDQKTDTVYATNFNDGTVSVIDGGTCNATVTSGCGQTPPTVTVGGSPDGAVVDDVTHTVYAITGGESLGSIAMIDTATCDGTHHTGCGRTPASVQAGSGPIWVVEDPATRTVYVANQEDSDVSVLNAAMCNARRQSGCARPLPAIAAGFSAGAVDVDIATDTVYYSSQGLNTVSVLNGATCNATHHGGCTRFAPTTTVGHAPQGVAVNQRTDTVYVGNRADNDLSVIDPRRCNAADRRGCSRMWPTVATGVTPQAVAVDERTDTVYTANSDPDNNNRGDTVSVIDGKTCNAHITSGCGKAPGTVNVGNGPGSLTVSERTDTIYVANGLDNTVSVIDGATCNATVRSGCGQTPGTIAIPAGTSMSNVAFDDRTDTLYVGIANAKTGAGRVLVIDGATCNGTVRSGCGEVRASVKVDLFPSEFAVDQRTETIYLLDFTPSSAGRVEVIDGAACNARVTRGCHRTPATMAVGIPTGIAVNQNTGAVYVDSFIVTDADVFNGAVCNAEVVSGCGQKPKAIATGGWPGDLAVSQATNTVYVPDNVDGEVSLFRR